MSEQNTQMLAGDHLRSFIERIERVLAEIDSLKDDVKDIFAEARGTGFDVKVMRKIIALRKKDEAERQEEDAILDTYLRAIGMYQAKFDFDEAA